MDQTNYTTEQGHIKNKHLSPFDRGQIQVLHRQRKSLREIAGVIGCSPTTIWNELRRGTKQKSSQKGRPSEYLASRGQKVYEERRQSCHRPCVLLECEKFLNYTKSKVLQDSWNLDECSGRAKLTGEIEGRIVCTKTLYNWVHQGKFLSPIDLPQMVSRKGKRIQIPKQHKKLAGRSIEERKDLVEDIGSFGHWEIDTVLGKKTKGESVILSLLERSTNFYMGLKIPSKTKEAVEAALHTLRHQFGSKFKEVFKSLTADNGTEFSNLALFESFGPYVFFAHPYTSCERAKNEKHNGILRLFIPKGRSINPLSQLEIEYFTDKMNGKPRKNLGYRTPEELFEAQLDRIYTLSAPSAS